MNKQKTAFLVIIAIGVFSLGLLPFSDHILLAIIAAAIIINTVLKS